LSLLYSTEFQFTTALCAVAQDLLLIPRQLQILLNIIFKCTGFIRCYHNLLFAPLLCNFHFPLLFPFSLFLFLPLQFSFSVEHGEAPDVKTAALMFQQLCYANKDFLSAGIIVAGWDKYTGGTVYNIPLGGSLHQQSFAIGGIFLAHFNSCLPLSFFSWSLLALVCHHLLCPNPKSYLTGSGSTYLYGYCDANYRENMSKEECLEFVKNCNFSSSICSFDRSFIFCLFFSFFANVLGVSLAIARDGSSGGVIRTAVITEHGIEKNMLPATEHPTFWQG